MTDEDRVVICQTEIRRLKAVIRDYARAIQNALDTDCRTLFGLWAALDDAEASGETLRLILKNLKFFLRFFLNHATVFLW